MLRAHYSGRSIGTLASADPFEQPKRSFPSRKRPSPPSRKALDACSRLAELDAQHMRATRGDRNAPELSESQRLQLWHDVLAIASESAGVMLGLCASSHQQGVSALKSWVSSLSLPRGLLHGADVGGAPTTLPGAVFIKYISSSGDAHLSSALQASLCVLFLSPLPHAKPP